MITRCEITEGEIFAFRVIILRQVTVSGQGSVNGDEENTAGPDNTGDTALSKQLTYTLDCYRIQLREFF